MFDDEIKNKNSQKQKQAGKDINLLPDDLRKFEKIAKQKQQNIKKKNKIDLKYTKPAEIKKQKNFFTKIADEFFKKNKEQKNKTSQKDVKKDFAKKDKIKATPLQKLYTKPAKKSHFDFSELKKNKNDKKHKINVKKDIVKLKKNTSKAKTIKTKNETDNKIQDVKTNFVKKDDREKNDFKEKFKIKQGKKVDLPHLKVELKKNKKFSWFDGIFKSHKKNKETQVQNKGKEIKNEIKNKIKDIKQDKNKAVNLLKIDQEKKSGFDLSKKPINFKNDAKQIKTDNGKFLDIKNKPEKNKEKENDLTKKNKVENKKDKKIEHLPEKTSEGILAKIDKQLQEDKPLIEKKGVDIKREGLGVNLIPEDLAVDVNRKKVKSILIFTVILSVLLVGVVYGLIYWQQVKKIKKVQAMRQEIKQKQDEIIAKSEDLQAMIVYQKSYDQVKGLMDHHIYWSPLFSFLEQNVAQGVVFNSVHADKNGLIKIDLDADNFIVLAQQYLIFKNIPEVVTVKLNGVSINADNEEETSLTSKLNENDISDLSDKINHNRPVSVYDKVLKSYQNASVSTSMVVQVNPDLFTKTQEEMQAELQNNKQKNKNEENINKENIIKKSDTMVIDENREDKN